MSPTDNGALADTQPTIADLQRLLDEALAREAALAEVLGVINSSPSDLAPVFDAILEKAMHLCEAAFGELRTFDGERFQSAAVRGVPVAFAESRGHNAAPAGAGSLGARVLEGQLIAHILDLKEEEPYRAGDENRRSLVDLGGARTALMASLRRDGDVFGFIILYRQQVRPFSDKQIALLQNFAAQAVIAMENARLVTETREALQQQTATAEVLGVINSSPGDLAPVFDAIVEKAHTLCAAASGSLQFWDGRKFRGVAIRGFPEAMVELLRAGYSPSGLPCQRIVEGERVVHCADLAEITREGGVKFGGVRTILYVALRKDDVLLGQIVAVWRSPPTGRTGPTASWPRSTTAATWSGRRFAWSTKTWRLPRSAPRVARWCGPNRWRRSTTRAASITSAPSRNSKTR